MAQQAGQRICAVPAWRRKFWISRQVVLGSAELMALAGRAGLCGPRAPCVAGGVGAEVGAAFPPPCTHRLQRAFEVRALSSAWEFIFPALPGASQSWDGLLTSRRSVGRRR